MKGGKSPQFTWTADKTTLKGKRLLAKVREAMGIGAPSYSSVDLPSAIDVVKAACTGTFQGGHQVTSGHPLKVQEDDDFTAPRCNECGRIDGAHSDTCSQRPNILTFEDYLAYAEFTKPKAPKSWARKWTLSREMDGPVQAWKLYWKELEDSGVTPFLQLCKCGHPLLKHKPEVRCDAKIGDQDCQCVKFVDSAKAEEPKCAKKGRAAR